MKIKNKSYLTAAIVIIVLATNLTYAISNFQPNITVNTDQPQYYPGEDITIYGRVTNNGSGVPMSPFCINLTDSNGDLIWGLCGITNSEGNYSITRPLPDNILSGDYEAEVHSIEFDVYATTPFEVVSTILIVEAHGPYEGTIGVPISFTGDVTGGKDPHMWHWDFGDTETSEEQNPDHTYSEAGEYVATLTVTDKEDYQGNDTAIVTINPGENQPPNNPDIEGETNGKYGETYTYTIVTTDPEEEDVKYVIDWGDDETTETEYYESGEEIEVEHTWDEEGTYLIKVKAIDEHDAESGWTELEVSMPLSQNLFDSFLFRLLERFPRAFPILRSILGM